MRAFLATAGFLFVAAFFLATEHRAHLFGVLPYTFVLACVFLHMFGHGGHDHGARRPPSDPHEGHGTGREGRS